MKELLIKDDHYFEDLPSTSINPIAEERMESEHSEPSPERQTIHIPETMQPTMQILHERSMIDSLLYLDPQYWIRQESRNKVHCFKLNTNFSAQDWPQMEKVIELMRIPNEEDNVLLTAML